MITERPSLPRRIVGFHQDAERHWVAELECGHTQHVRHDPPWQERPWVVTEEGRLAFLGATLQCVLCAEAESRERDPALAPSTQGTDSEEP